MRILGLVILVIALSVGIGPYLGLMLDVPSLIIVLGGSLGALLFAGQRLGNMFRAVFSSAATRDDLLAAAGAWKLAGAFALAMGAIGLVIGLVIMLKNMDDPAAIGPGMAVAILPVFYGLLLEFGIALPVRSRLEDRAGAAA